MPAVEPTPSFTIHYVDLNPEGSHTILLLHGLGATGESWRFQRKPLTDAGFRVLAPDLRGFGRSSRMQPCRSIQQMASDVFHLLNTLRIKKVHAVGISMGGAVALQMAADRPELIDRLVLVNTFSKLRPPTLSGWFYFAFRFLLVHTLGLPTQARKVARRVFPRPEQETLRQAFYDQVVQADPRCYRAAMRALARFNIHQRLGKISSPTLVISGDKDTTVPHSLQRAMTEAIPSACQIIIPDGGHGVSVDKPEAFNRSLLNFLDQK
jgi:3-oxoadipate enol-lactonase